MAKSAIVSKRDDFARDSAKAWEIWWYRRYRRNLFYLCTMEDRFSWRGTEETRVHLDVSLFNAILLREGAAAFPGERSDPDNPVQMLEQSAKLSSPQISLEFHNLLPSAQPQPRAGDVNTGFAILSEPKFCSKSHFGRSSTLEIL